MKKIVDLVMYQNGIFRLGNLFVDCDHFMQALELYSTLSLFSLICIYDTTVNSGRS